jgi:hypothetical protein
MMTSLFSYRVASKNYEKYSQKHQVTPPDHWIPKEIDPVTVAREELTL